MVAPPDGPPAYEMRDRPTWKDYLAGSLFVAGGAFVIVVGGVRAYPVTIGFTVVCAVVGVAHHLRTNGRLLLRADGRGIEFTRSGLFVAWPDVLDADMGYSGDDRAVMIRVVRGSVVPLSERGEKRARSLNRPRQRRGRPDPHAELAISSLDLLDRGALSAVIRTHAPHVTGRFGAG